MMMVAVAMTVMMMTVVAHDVNDCISELQGQCWFSRVLAMDATVSVLFQFIKHK
jgi:hypothetical protein